MEVNCGLKYIVLNIATPRNFFETSFSPSITHFKVQRERGKRKMGQQNTPYIRDRGQQRKQDLRRGDNDDIESVRAEHPGLVAARFLAADLDGLFFCAQRTRSRTW